MQYLDNTGRQRLGDALRESIDEGAKLSIIASYFTIFAYGELKDELSKVEEPRFIFDEPTFAKKGCIIADSVGLGKTYEALAIIKQLKDAGFEQVKSEPVTDSLLGLINKPEEVISVKVGARMTTPLTTNTELIRR